MSKSKHRKVNFEPKTIEEAVVAVQEYLLTGAKMRALVVALENLLPAKDMELTPAEFECDFLTGDPFCDDDFCQRFGMDPSSIALVTLHEFLNDDQFFEKIDPASLPNAANLAVPYEPQKLTFTTIEMGARSVTVPESNKLWLREKATNTRLTVEYAQTMMGLLVTVRTATKDHKFAIEFSADLRARVMRNPLIRGQIIEVSSGDSFRVVDVGSPVAPVMDDELKQELEKNVINLFKKQDEFKKYGLGLKRAIILEGSPGCGKTMIARWLAAEVRGTVTTLWVTAKSIGHPEHVASVFAMARLLSPCLVVMEDLDLISGSRSHMGSAALGEMLNQLDGLTTNESLVLVGTTNHVNSLDSALKDRPGRFDRVYAVKLPEGGVAETIARNYLKARGVSEPVIEGISYTPLMSGEFTGAQIVEIMKGGIFEAIHAGGEITDLCMKRSMKGIVAQRERNKTKT